MAQRLEFVIQCPNNHDQTVKFDPNEFEQKLKSGTLIFHCEVCDANWPPTREEIAHFNREFAKTSE